MPPSWHAGQALNTPARRGVRPDGGQAGWYGRPSKVLPNVTGWMAGPVTMSTGRTNAGAGGCGSECVAPSDVRVRRSAAGGHPENGRRGRARRAGRQDDGRRHRNHAAGNDKSSRRDGHARFSFATGAGERQACPPPLGMLYLTDFNGHMNENEDAQFVPGFVSKFVRLSLC
jgi:hypothetical protein